MSATYFFGTINESRGSAYDPISETPHQFTGQNGPLPIIRDLVLPYMSWSTLWFSLLCVFVALNMKNMPLMWHMRILNAFRFILRTQRPPVPFSPSHIFQPIITSSSAQLMELDFNLHKSNSSYFADVDIARTHLVCTLFARGISAMRGGTAAYTGSSQPVFGLALGAVSCAFRRELRPYARYDMWSKILAWDDKWIYIVTHFTRPESDAGAAAGAATVAADGKNVASPAARAPRGYSLYPQQGSRSAPASRRGSSDALSSLPLATAEEKEETEALRRSSVDSAASEPPEKQLYATALSKCVFKSGRKTVSPQLMLELSGLLPSARDEESGEKGEEEARRTLESSERQRLRGLKIASQLAAQNQQNLEAEFEGADGEALGRHTDGAGIVGVVNTLLQLAHLKKGQVL